MGQQSCVIVLAVLAISLAVIVNVTAFGAPRWLEGTYRNASGGNDSDVTEGLWQVCSPEGCVMFSWADKESWFRAVQGLYSVATGMCILTLVVFCSIFAMNMSTERMYLIIWFVMITNVVSSVCFCVALGLFGKRAPGSEWPIAQVHDSHLSWAFYVAIWGAVFSLASTALLIWEGCMAASWFKIRPYYDI